MFAILARQPRLCRRGQLPVTKLAGEARFGGEEQCTCRLHEVHEEVADGVVLVVWSGQTPTRAVRTAIDILNDNHANFYGFVLNRLDLMATMNRFHYYYYTNHYYNRYQSVTRAPNSPYEQAR